jgi:hypothetical protein
MSLAEKAEGRIISGTVHFRLTPPQAGELGDTDAAVEIGKGLMRESMLVLQEAAKREGFEVEIEFRQVVY